MRAFVLFLCLLNVILAAQLVQGYHAPAPRPLATEIQAERVRLLTPKALTSLPIRASTQAEPATTSPASTHATITDPATATVDSGCYNWGTFKPAQVNAVLAWLQPLHVTATVANATQGTVEKRYWLYKPPLPSAEAAQAKLDELLQLGVEDAFIVQSNQYKYAISLGIFRDQQLADQWLRTLAEKGVRGVVKAVRYAGAGQVVLHLHGLDLTQLQQLKNGLAQFPDSELTPETCPA